MANLGATPTFKRAVPSSELTQQSQRRHLALYFALAFGISWAILLPEALASAGVLSKRVPTALIVAAGFGPALAALATSAVQAGREGVRSLLQRLVILRVPWIWYVVAALGPALILLAARALEQALGGSVPPLGQPPLQTELGLADLPTGLFLAALFVNNLFVTLGEELGWRGFALPRMQWRRTGLVAGVTLGLLWGLWHLPLIWTPATRSAVAELPLWAFLIDVTAASILYVWLFNHTRGSVAIATLAHTANNTAAVFLMPVEAISSRHFLLTVAVRLAAVLLALGLDGHSVHRA